MLFKKVQKATVYNEDMKALNAYFVNDVERGLLHTIQDVAITIANDIRPATIQRFIPAYVELVELDMGTETPISLWEVAITTCGYQYREQMSSKCVEAMSVRGITTSLNHHLVVLTRV